MRDRIQESIEIAASPAEVWAVAQDYEKRHLWDPRVLDAELLTGRLGEGARVRYHLRLVMGLRFWLVLSYERFDPPRGSAIRMVERSLLAPYAEARGSWRVEEQAAHRTRFVTTFRYRLRFGWWGRLLDWLWVRRATERETRRALSQLAALVEG